MALQIWLPLNGNLNNQGLTSISLSSGTPTYTNGKIGQCLSTGSLAFNISNNLIATLGSTNIYSLCCWCKNLNTSTASRWVFQIGSGTGTSRGLWESNNTAARHWAYSGSGDNISTSINPIDGNWHHVCFTSNGSTVKLYIDGVAQGQKTGASTTAMAGEVLYLTATDYNLNDFRLYDHVLSPREVKEIAKCLVLHYPLNRGGFGQNNLIITNSMAPASGTSGWSCAGTGWANSNVESSGASSGRAIRCTYSGTSQTSGGIHHPPGINKEDLTNGATYTLSARIRASKNCTATFYNELMPVSSSIGLTTDWKIYTYSHSIDNTRTYYSNVIYVSAADVTQNMWIECDWIKLEEGGKATPYIPNTAEAKYISMGLNSNIEYDCSGFGYNGTTTGTFTYSSDTPRYNVSTYFQDYTRYITASLNGWTPTNITLSCWIKGSNKSPRGNWHTPLNLDGQKAEISIGTSGKARVGFTIGGTRYIYDWGNDILNGTWHLITNVFDGSAIKMYVDGTLVNSTNVSGALQSATNVYVGRFNGVDTYGNTQLYESDVRVYATALSADDILELYHTPISLANNGVLLSQVLQE